MSDHQDFYSYEGTDYVSVTTALQIIHEKWLDRWRRHVGFEEADRKLREGQEMGTATHDKVKEVLESNGFGTTADIENPTVAMMTEQVLEWCAQNMGESVAMESRMYSLKFKFCGQPDIVAPVRGSKLPYVIDIKTGNAKSKKWGLQTSAYKQILKENDIKTMGRIILHVPNKNPILEEIILPSEEDVSDLNAFLMAKELYIKFNKR